jgi:hypothetical protein
VPVKPASHRYRGKGLTGTAGSSAYHLSKLKGLPCIIDAGSGGIPVEYISAEGNPQLRYLIPTRFLRIVSSFGFFISQDTFAKLAFPDLYLR